MTEERKPTIADDERSPAAKAADEVPFGPSGTKEADEHRPEPEGTAGVPEEVARQQDEEHTVPPARGHH